MLSFQSRSLPWTLASILALFGSVTAPVWAQTVPPAAGSTTTTPAIPNADPTRPEVQPPLDVVRDPVLSPEVADNTPKNQGTAIAKQSGSNAYVLHENVDEVLLRCAVLDNKGNLVTNLTQSDFQVWEDGIPQTIRSFEHHDQPASIGLLVDNSGSMRDKRAAVDSAALELIRESNPKDTAFVVNFSDRAYLDQGFTSNIDAIEKGLSRFDSAGPTALYDAVDASADELSKDAKWPAQVLVIITDGEDDASRLTLQQAIHRVQQLGGPVVYTIGLLYDADSKQEAQQARDALETLSDETGGIAYFPRSLDEVQGVAEQIARDIRNEYVLGYNPPPASVAGAFRTVRVEAQARGYAHLIVRTRKGYYAKAHSLAPSSASGSTAPAAHTPAE
jgi:VWFA-related protein